MVASTVTVVAPLDWTGEVGAADAGAALVGAAVGAAEGAAVGAAVGDALAGAAVAAGATVEVGACVAAALGWDVSAAGEAVAAVEEDATAEGGGDSTTIDGALDATGALEDAVFGAAVATAGDPIGAALAVPQAARSAAATESLKILFVFTLWTIRSGPDGPLTVTPRT